MSEQIILNRLEKEIQEQEKYFEYCNNQLKYLSHEEDIKCIKKNPQMDVMLNYGIKLRKNSNLI